MSNDSKTQQDDANELKKASRQGFKKGMKRHPDAGRKKGQRNMKAVMATEACEKHGINVFEFMAMVVADKHEELGQKKSLSMDLRVKTASDLAKYCAPQLKSIEGRVEHTVDVIGDLLKGLDRGAPLVSTEGNKLPDVVVTQAIQPTNDTKSEPTCDDVNDTEGLE